jgi:N-acetyl-anhydromuramyl-L-alanine amidase AmpD
MEAKWFRTKALLKIRDTDPVAVIVHGTGEVSRDKCISLYVHSKTQPHYMIAIDGEVCQFADEEQVAGHAGMQAAERLLYRAGYSHWSTHQWSAEKKVGEDMGYEQGRYRHWRDFWRNGKGLDSPIELCTGTTPNDLSIGIELQSPARRGPNIYSDVQYFVLAELLRDICDRHKIPMRRGRILGHCDVSPLRRYFDPGDRFNWLKLWDLVGTKD